MLPNQFMYPYMPGGFNFYTLVFDTKFNRQNVGEITII